MKTLCEWCGEEIRGRPWYVRWEWGDKEQRILKVCKPCEIVLEGAKREMISYVA